MQKADYSFPDFSIFLDFSPDYFGIPTFQVSG